MCVALKYQREKKAIDVYQLYGIMVTMKVKKHVKYSHSIVKLRLNKRQGQSLKEIKHILRRIMFTDGCSLWLLTEEQINIYDETTGNMILSVSGLGSARVHYNADFCMFRFYPKFPLYHPT